MAMARHTDKELTMRKILEECPTCGGGLTITEVRCDACGTQVRSLYRPCPFCALTEEQQTFLMLFLRSRGNLKDVEKTLGISYPTVRAKVDELIDALEPRPVAPGQDQRRAILNALQTGQLAPSEALALLRQQSEAKEG